MGAMPHITYMTFPNKVRPEETRYRQYCTRFRWRRDVCTVQKSWNMKAMFWCENEEDFYSLSRINRVGGHSRKNNDMRRDKGACEMFNRPSFEIRSRHQSSEEEMGSIECVNIVAPRSTKFLQSASPSALHFRDWQVEQREPYWSPSAYALWICMTANLTAMAPGLGHT